jgi:hypothetical protein
LDQLCEDKDEKADLVRGVANYRRGSINSTIGWPLGCLFGDICGWAQSFVGRHCSLVSDR